MSYKNHGEDTEDGDQEEQENTHSNASIIDVWLNNYVEQLKQISSLSKSYNVIALDTEFPGTFVSKSSLLELYNNKQIDYQHIRLNIQNTKLIQIGISLSDQFGNSPKQCIWQFHLKFDDKNQNIVTQSIDLLKQAGIDFKRLANEGIPHQIFAEALLSSGLVLNKNLRWIVFHGCYDFGYLLRQIRREPLPKTTQEFYKSIKIYFPNINDVKQIIQNTQNFQPLGLDALANRLGCLRIGSKHQAGSDSNLTLRCYLQLKRLMGDLHIQNFTNKIYGISSQNQGFLWQNYHFPVNPLYQFLQQNQQNGKSNGSYQINY